MCGIALIIAGVRIDLSSLLPDYEFPSPESDNVHHAKVSVEDLKAALQRRGPDHLGSKKVFLQLETSSYVEKENVSLVVKNDCISSATEVMQEDDFIVINSVAELHFIGATLQLRGITPVYQPLVDTSGNILVYNGEIFGGLHVRDDNSDTETLFDALGRCCSSNFLGHGKACSCCEEEKTSVVGLLSTIKGPWALIYWQDNSKTLWFGRDALGRRSLLVHWPTLDDARLLLSSVTPSVYTERNSYSEVEDKMSDPDFWEELSCGIYSICLDSSKLEESPIGKVRKHEWSDPELKELIKWERTHVEPSSNRICSTNDLVERKLHVIEPTDAQEPLSGLDKQGYHTAQQIKPCAYDSILNNGMGSGSNLISKGTVRPSVSLPAQKVLIALRESVRRRTTLNTIFRKTIAETRQETLVPVAVLFSGGLDSMILAALLDECLDPSYDIDLLNVSFDGQSAPDRISARAGVKELQRIAPSRRWNLVEIDDDLSNLTSETKHVMSLINPSKTYMDLNIGIALWLAAGGDGWVDKEISDNHIEDYQRLKYKSEAKILLVGSGADEQCAGYSRHRTKYRLGGWLGLHEEMRLDMQRIWKRNLGRDDRCISDKGKEARFPFLDEDVIRTLLEFPLWEVADLDQPIGRGDKKILREVAQLLGLEAAAFLPKRAIQARFPFLDEDVIRTLLEFPLWEVADLDQPIGRGDKKILREVAQLLGLEAAAFLPKRAIQFGSRIARESNRKNFGSNRAANQASAGSVVIHKPAHIT